VEIKAYTKEDFMDSLEPYEFVYSFRQDSFIMEKVVTAVAAVAQKQGIRNFKKMFQEYVKSQKQSKSLIVSNSVTQFEGQELELDAGDWRADDFGITIDTVFGEVKACEHPIIPVQRLVNIDTGIEKVKIAYRKGRQWRTLIADKRTLASSTSIVSLSDSGIGVTSENAKYLVRYLHDLEHLNYESIPEKNCVSRLGWIDGQGFAPYVDDLAFDGDANFKSYFDSVRQQGNFEEWLKVARIARQNLAARIVLAASFASVLVKPLNVLPFFVHMWGGTEVGKTVGLMVAASVWANPEMGKYIHSFNSTLVGRERSAAFVNSLPLIMDELQIIKDKKQFDHDIYTLSEGVGKARGNKFGGMDKTSTWNNCILTSGEMPLTCANSGGGAVNRIVEIECKDVLFADGRGVCNIIKKNYGHAGRKFVDYLNEDGVMDIIEATFSEFHNQLSKSDRTEKQAISGALVLTADKIISELFFDGQHLKANDIVEFLQTKKSVSSNAKGYEYLCGWVAQNINFFQENGTGQAYGKIEGDCAFIIKKIFDDACSEAGFNPTAILSYLKENNLIQSGSNRLTIGRKINKLQTWCVGLKMPDEGEMIFNG
jgi:hypothetical protein